MDHLLLGTVESPKLGISVQRTRWRIGAKNGRWCQGHSKIRRNVRRMIEIAPQGIILYTKDGVYPGRCCGLRDGNIGMIGIMGILGISWATGGTDLPYSVPPMFGPPKWIHPIHSTRGSFLEVFEIKIHCGTFSPQLGEIVSHCKQPWIRAHRFGPRTPAGLRLRTSHHACHGDDVVDAI